MIRYRCGLRSPRAGDFCAGACGDRLISFAATIFETTKPAAGNLLQRQARFDTVIKCYNNERPHHALNMRCPAELYLPSTRPYTGLPDLDYPFHDKTVTVTTCGRICFQSQKINLSMVFAGQSVGVKQVSDQIWLVSFMDYDLGYFDHWTCRLEPFDNHSVQKCYLCLRHKP